MDADILELNEKAKEEAKSFRKRRFIFKEIEKFLSEKVFIGLVGPRGTGKTVILKQLLLQLDQTAFYLSLDTVRIPNLYDFAKELSGRGIETILLDEIHIHPNFQRDLKKIYDFLEVKIIFTSSCAISIYESAYDLSRRVRTITIPSLSYREYIFFDRDVEIQEITLDNLTDQKTSKEYMNPLFTFEVWFEAYLKGRNHLFAFNSADPIPLYKNVLSTILSKDIFFTGTVEPGEIGDIENVLRFVGLSPAEGISYSSISANTGLTKYKAQKYASVLEKAFILQRVWPKGTNITKEPKILFSLPYRLLYRSYSECIGALREDFFVSSIYSAKLEINYLKSSRGEKTPDYLLGDVVFEIGGSGKSRRQFKGFTNKRKMILTQPGEFGEDRRPLFFIGML